MDQLFAERGKLNERVCARKDHDDKAEKAHSLYWDSICDKGEIKPTLQYVSSDCRCLFAVADVQENRRASDLSPVARAKQHLTSPHFQFTVGSVFAFYEVIVVVRRHLASSLVSHSRTCLLG
jgi:hypothetical protein